MSYTFTVPTDEEIQAAIGTTTHSVQDIKYYALKVLCGLHTCHTAEQILIELGLMSQLSKLDRSSNIYTQKAVWQWFGGNV